VRASISHKLEGGAGPDTLSFDKGGRCYLMRTQVGFSTLTYQRILIRIHETNVDVGGYADLCRSQGSKGTRYRCLQPGGSGRKVQFMNKGYLYSKSDSSTLHAPVSIAPSTCAGWQQCPHGEVHTRGAAQEDTRGGPWRTACKHIWRCFLVALWLIIY
jgi:hypothetical protein